MPVKSLVIVCQKDKKMLLQICAKKFSKPLIYDTSKLLLNAGPVPFNTILHVTDDVDGLYSGEKQDEKLNEIDCWKNSKKTPFLA